MDLSEGVVETMTVLIFIMWIVLGYVAGWFTTALAITQVGTVKRGCALGCTHQRNPNYDRYYHSGRQEPMFIGNHNALCNRPHFELVRAEEAAMYALAWPYLWFYGVLATSELNARKRYEKQQKLKARRDNPLTAEKLKEIDDVLADTNMVVSDDGRIVHLKELESS
jgi:hypothetical protein